MTSTASRRYTGTPDGEAATMTFADVGGRFELARRIDRSDLPWTSSVPPGSVMLRALRISARRDSETPAVVSASWE